MRKELVLPVTAAVSGAAGFFLRRWELASAFEADTGLPIPGMPATWALIALSAAAVLALALLCRGSHRVFPVPSTWPAWWRPPSSWSSPGPSS